MGLDSKLFLDDISIIGKKTTFKFKSVEGTVKCLKKIEGYTFLMVSEVKNQIEISIVKARVSVTEEKRTGDFTVLSSIKISSKQSKISSEFCIDYLEDSLSLVIGNEIFVIKVERKEKDSSASSGMIKEAKETEKDSDSDNDYSYSLSLLKQFNLIGVIYVTLFVNKDTIYAGGSSHNFLKYNYYEKDLLLDNSHNINHSSEIFQIIKLKDNKIVTV